MARTFTAGRTDQEALATEPTQLEILAALGEIQVDIEQQTNPVIVSDASTATIGPGSNQVVTGAYVVPVGKKLRMKGVTVVADGDGWFYLRINGSDDNRFSFRNSWAQKGETVGVEFTFVAGDTIEIEAKNTSTHGNTNDYYGSWWGYLEDI